MHRLLAAPGVLAAALLAGASSYAPATNVLLTPSAGFGIGYNGNNGPYNPASPALVPDNQARASHGAIVFGSSALGSSGSAVHLIANANDGLYGNNHSWIAATGDAAPFIGVAFSGPVAMDSIAWGRDNGDDVTEGQLTDRSMGQYILQFTRIGSPNSATAVTGDPLTGWAPIGTIDYQNAQPGVFDPSLRHQFVVREGADPIVATGFRLRVPFSGLADGTAIDELEVNGTSVPEPSMMTLAGLAAVFVTRRGRR